MKSSFYQYPFHELQALCAENSLPPASARLLFNWFYKKNKRAPYGNLDLANKAKNFFQDKICFDLPEIAVVKESADQTVKFLFKLRGASEKEEHEVETVLIPFHNKYTICLSSQVGCAMKCSFCFTGEQGYKRNLSVDEIVGQFLQAKKWLTENRPGDDRILNIVFMGQGEPLHNFDAVKKSVEIFLTQYGLSIAPHKITVSTSGYLPGLQRWKSEMPNVNIALSLHSPFDEKRSQLIPINRRYPLQDILPFLSDIPFGEKRFVTYEYLLLKDFNDSNQDARALGELLKGKRAYINLIPFNPFPGSIYKRPEANRVLKFKNVLDSFKIPTTIRTTKGDSILAACGQLNTTTN